MAKKPVVNADIKEVIYPPAQWQLFRKLRQKSRTLLEVLANEHIPAIIHGSIARGDVSKKSDIDIFIPIKIPSFKLLSTLQQAKLNIYSQQILQATPSDAIKAHIYIDEKTSISFPLVEFSSREREFYTFGGETNLDGVRQELRVPGVDKRLMLIRPTTQGHMESPVSGDKNYVSYILGVSPAVVDERMRVLLRRDEVGRTGVFVKHELGKDETFEEAVQEIKGTGMRKFRRWKAV